MPGRDRAERPERDAAYLQDIVDSCKAIEMYTHGKTVTDFLGDPMLQDAVARRLFIIGEGAKCVSETFKRKLPALDWKNIGRLRDKLGHHYWTIEIDKLWEIVTDHVSVLRRTLERDPILKG
jgi:uncharacterized protein with HEPN domain